MKLSRITLFQNLDNNGDFWNRLEIYCRDLSKDFDSVRVISGPLWLPKSLDKEEEDEGKDNEDDDEREEIKGEKHMLKKRDEKLGRKKLRKKTPKVMKYEVSA